MSNPTPLIDPALEDTLAAVESRLASLGEALRARDAAAIDSHATELHRALARAVDHFTHAARSGSVPPTLRRRLARASGQVAAQRESLARATAALDRAIEVLMPRDVPGLYSSIGGSDRSGLRGGSVQA
ncbi:hypothetical protein [Piscinibacter sp.]|uniref:hypothetical protein n=1 Tax=Piscinibacter sp. TaxID=1903157 RepID=UPI002C7BF7AB|nr:hypothetical protein [Albitalea sp.]HUG24534.1 hypothetical protein [Albitalea sp.]